MFTHEHNKRFFYRLNSNKDEFYVDNLSFLVFNLKNLLLYFHGFIIINHAAYTEFNICYLKIIMSFTY